MKQLTASRVLWPWRIILSVAIPSNGCLRAVIFFFKQKEFKLVCFPIAVIKTMIKSYLG